MVADHLQLLRRLPVGLVLGEGVRDHAQGVSRTERYPGDHPAGAGSRDRLAADGQVRAGRLGRVVAGGMVVRRGARLGAHRERQPGQRRPGLGPAARPARGGVLARCALAAAADRCRFRRHARGHGRGDGGDAGDGPALRFGRPVGGGLRRRRRVVRLAVRPATAGRASEPVAVPAAGAAPGRVRRDGLHVPRGAGGGRGGQGASGGMGGMSATGSRFSFLALVLALFLLGWAVRVADRLTVRAPEVPVAVLASAVPVASGPQESGALMMAIVPAAGGPETAGAASPGGGAGPACGVRTWPPGARRCARSRWASPWATR